MLDGLGVSGVEVSVGAVSCSSLGCGVGFGVEAIVAAV